MGAGYLDDPMNGTQYETYDESSYEDAYTKADFDYLYEIGTDEQVLYRLCDFSPGIA